MSRFARMSFVRKLRRFVREQRGIAAVEFAIISTVLTMALLGGTEIARYTLMHQKMDRVSSSVADWTSQSSILMSTDFDNFFAGANQVAKPFDLGAKGIVIISFIIAETDSTYRVSWQRTGGGTLAQASRIGTPGGIATLPAGITLVKGDCLVAAEVYAQYDPFVFADLVGTSVVYKRSFIQPRSPDIITIQ